MCTGCSTTVQAQSCKLLFDTLPILLLDDSDSASTRYPFAWDGWRHGAHPGVQWRADAQYPQRVRKGTGFSKEFAWRAQKQAGRGAP